MKPLKLNLRLVGIIIWAVGLSLVVYLLIQNIVVPYDQINQSLVSKIETLGVVIMAFGILLVFIYSLMIVSKRRKKKTDPSQNIPPPP